MIIKMKSGILAILVVIIIASFVGYFLLSQKDDVYRLDCGKPITTQDILFVYTQSCPHCHADWIKIQEMGISDEFYMIDAGNGKCQEIIMAYSDYIIEHENSNYQAPPGIFTPTKVCIHSNQTFIGEQSKEELKTFLDGCK